MELVEVGSCSWRVRFEDEEEESDLLKRSLLELTGD